AVADRRTAVAREDVRLVAPQDERVDRVGVWAVEQSRHLGALGGRGRMTAGDRTEPEHQQRRAAGRAQAGDRRREPPAEPAPDCERAGAADEPGGDLLQRGQEGEVWMGDASMDGETGEAV